MCIRIDVLNVYSFYYVMKGRIKMGNKEFIEKCKEIVKQYAMEHLDKSEEIPNFMYMLCGELRHYKITKHY